MAVRTDAGTGSLLVEVRVCIESFPGNIARILVAGKGAALR